MSNQVLAKKSSSPVKTFFGQENVQKKFNEILGKRSTSFMTSVLQIVASNSMLEKAEPITVYQAAMMAATLDLPINNNLGFAYIIPYSNKGEVQAQFQLGYKAFIQLAQRSGQFKTISATPIYEGQIVSENPLTGFEFDFKVKGEKVVGYAAYFELINGFEKTLYMTVDQLREHGQKFSQSYRNQGKNSLWGKDFDSMAIKTVLKLLLSKYAPLSVEMQSAVLADQGVINDVETQDISYVDNTEEKEPEKNPEKERILLMIEDAKTEGDLTNLESAAKKMNDKEVMSAFNAKLDVLLENKG